LPRTKKNAVVFFACLASSGVCAQPASETAFFEELPVVLTASRMPQSMANTPGAVTVLDRELIRATGYRDLARLLKLVPGFTVPQSRGHAYHPSYHGLAAEFPNRMQVLIDGRSVYTPFFVGGVDWGGLPITIDEIERIEVLRGSNSATYGSNAFLGVVNIVTRHSAQDRGTAVHATAGSTDIRVAGFRHGGQSGDLSYRVNGEYRSDSGFGNSNDDRHGTNLTFRADYRLRSGQELTFLAGLHDGARGFGFAGTPGNSNGEREAQFTNGFVHVRWRRELSAGSELSIGYYRNQERTQERWNASAPPFFPVIPVDFDRNSVRDNVDLQHIVAFGPRLRVVWGAELRRDAIESPRFFTAGEDSQSVGRAYANAEWRALDALVLNGGAMLEKYSGHGAKIAPRLFANWQVARKHTLRAGASRAYRAPSLFEEHGDLRFLLGGILLLQNFTPPASLKPERIDALELGYLGRFPAWNGTLDVRVYRERIYDFISDRGVLSPLVPPPLFSPATAMMFNSDHPIVSRGIEAQLRVRPFESTDLLAGYAHARLSGAPGTLDASAPRNSGSLTWIQRYPGRIASTLTVYRTASYQWSGGARPTPAYTAYDARVSFQALAFGRPAEFALVLLNQGRAHEELTWGDAQGRTLATRQAYVTARLDF